MATKAKRRITPRRVLLTILKILYILLVALCAVVVVIYIVFKAAVKPPEVEGAPTVEIPVVQTTPNPMDVIRQELEEEQDAQSEAEPSPEVTTVQLVRKENFHTFLVMGTDDGNGNTDTIMVAAYDVTNGKVSVLSVPRDTLVDVSRTVKKINAAYGAGGVEQLMDEVEGILGFRPDHYVKVDLRAFVAVVDQLGGLSFYIPEDMYHNDGAGFIIDLPAGTRWLNGEEAMQVVRYRGYQNQSADIGRIQTQQKFIKELAKQLVSRSTLSDIDDYAAIVDRYLDTDLTLSELVWFGTQALSLDFSTAISFATLPGEGNVKYQGISSYYGLYPDECYELVNATVNPYTTDIPRSLVNIFQAN